MDNHLPSSADPITEAASLPRGRRPEFTDDPMLDRLYGVTLALVSELAVTRARLDTLERLLDRKAVLPTASIESFSPAADEADARARMHEQYLERVLRALHD